MKIVFPKGEKVKHCHQQTYQLTFLLVPAAVTCIQNVEEESKDTHPGSGGGGGGGEVQYKWQFALRKTCSQTLILLTSVC